ncbi:MAG: hypothetical protein PSV13_13905 [Lacunisphaera sp.]|nr:hypothetical protein [Lacunisphaera sp.]
MPSLTRHPTGDSIRKLGLLAALSAIAFGGGGCATSGPNHVYLAQENSPAVQDLGPTPAVVGGAVSPGERVTGLAYDFNTDHLFLRISPAQVIRVIERPSGKILREMPLADDLKADGPADLAIRSADRHLFAVHPDGRSVVELTLFGEFVHRLALRAPADPIGGLAYDQKNHRLLVLTATFPARIGSVAPDGFVTYYVTLAGAVRPVSLGFDSDAQHCFVPLADGTSLGEFDATGALVQTHRTGDTGSITAVDAGPRAFVRVF